MEVLAIQVTFQDTISLLTRLVFKESLRAVNRHSDRKEHVRLDVLQTERTPLLFLLKVLRDHGNIRGYIPGSRNAIFIGRLLLH